MIPGNINRDHIIMAIKEIDENGVPKKRHSRKYLLEFNGRHYPPKYVISLANKYANGHELNPEKFGGGKVTNGFLEMRGFSIIEI